MASRKKLCILSFSDIARDSRVLREIEIARHHFEVDVIGYGDWQPTDGVNFIRVPKNLRSHWFLLRYFILLILGRFFPKAYETAFWLKSEYGQASHYLNNSPHDLIHANDWDALPVAANAAFKKKIKVLFDAHEYSPEQEADHLIWRLLARPFKIYLLNKNLPVTHQNITVASGIAELYKENFNADCQIIMNAQVYQEVNFKPTNAERINIIHHGFAMPGRQLEEMIRMISLTDQRFTLLFMLVPAKQAKYLQELKYFSQSYSPGRVKFLTPVSPSSIVTKINSFDLGLPFLSAPNLNMLHSLPNKFFDYIMAGLGVVISPLPSMARIINQHGIGRIAASQSPEDMASMLNSLTADEINQFKRNSLELAKQVNAENEMEKLLKIYRELLAN